jgi:hypothetical protein
MPCYPGPSGRRSRRGPDKAALDRLAEWRPPVLIEGRRVLVCRPRACTISPDFDHSAFDRAICPAGVRQFIRPVTPSDQPDAELQLPGSPALPTGLRFETPWVLVTEVAAGVRQRVGVTLYFAEKV